MRLNVLGVDAGISTMSMHREFLKQHAAWGCDHMTHKVAHFGLARHIHEQCEESTAHTCPSKPKVRDLDDRFWIKQLAKQEL